MSVMILTCVFAGERGGAHGTAGVCEEAGRHEEG